MQVAKCNVNTMSSDAVVDDVIEKIPNRYSKRIGRSLVTTGRETRPQASVIIVTYRTETSELRRTLDALASQTVSGFEIVLVDNDHREDLESVIGAYDIVRQYVRLHTNYGITFARNLGAKLARADLLVFLDDDAIPRLDFVEQHVLAHREHDIVAARGKVLPRTDSVYNRLQWWYDLGDEPFPFYLNIEGNTSFEREAFISLSGFDEDLLGRAGHEGVELTYRFIRSGYGRDKLIYYPDAVIHHDNASGLRSYLHKRITDRRNGRLLKTKHPELAEFIRSYPTPIIPSPNRGLSDRLVALMLAITVTVADAVVPESTL